MEVSAPGGQEGITNAFSAPSSGSPACGTPSHRAAPAHFLQEPRGEERSPALRRHGPATGSVRCQHAPGAPSPPQPGATKGKKIKKIRKGAMHQLAI